MKHTTHRVIRCATLDILSRELAVNISRQISTAIELRGKASMVVSGGRTPISLFKRLRGQPIAWNKVHITLADERWVSVSDDASNEKLVRDYLLAGAADFIGMKTEDATPDLAANAVWKSLSAVPRPFDVVLLGIGDDGHTASLFPGSPQLLDALDPSAVPGLVGTRAPKAPEARLSLNLSALLDSRRILIMMTGEQKWATYLTAMKVGSIKDMPIRGVLEQAKVPVEVWWSP